MVPNTRWRKRCLEPSPEQQGLGGCQWGCGGCLRHGGQGALELRVPRTISPGGSIQLHVDPSCQMPKHFVE